MDESYSEDCHFVNINLDKRNLDNGHRAPIMYFIHGGGFNSGTANGIYTDLVGDQNVTTISIGYRLGGYGFIWSPEPENPEESPYSGNWGILDQRAAMIWAQKWGPYFAADTSQATLNGCSAGSESVWWHIGKLTSRLSGLVL